MQELYCKLFREAESAARERDLDALFHSLSRHLKRNDPARKIVADCGRLNKHDPKSDCGSFDITSLQAMWRYATAAWAKGWPLVGVAPATDSQSDSDEPDLHELPVAAVRDIGNGNYKFRSYIVEAASVGDAWRALSVKYAAEQSNTRRAQRVAKHAKRKTLSRAVADAENRPGAVYNLEPPRAVYKEVYRGRLCVGEGRSTFTEEGTWFEVTVEDQKQAGKRETEHRRDEKLYLALQAAHAKAKRQSCADTKRNGLKSQLPQTINDLEVKRKASTGHLVYAFNNFEAPVTPRQLRQTPPEELSRTSQARLRESTPERALRKLREKIKRSVSKATRGEHEAIVAQTSFNKTWSSTCEESLREQVFISLVNQALHEMLRKLDTIVTGAQSPIWQPRFEAAGYLIFDC